MQADAFDLVGLPMIQNTLAGFNTSLVCYGQRARYFAKCYSKGVGFLFSASLFLFSDANMYVLLNASSVALAWGAEAAGSGSRHTLFFSSFVELAEASLFLISL